LSAEQIEGLGLLQVLEKARTSALADYQREEDALMSQLKKLRAEREEFGVQLRTLVPEWGNILKARRTRLTQVERIDLLNNFE